MTKPAPILIAVTFALSIIRLLMPTVPHSWFMVFVALAHIFVGMMVLRLVQLRGRWPLGWICLAGPTLLELGMFLAKEG